MAEFPPAGLPRVGAVARRRRLLPGNPALAGLLGVLAALPSGAAPLEIPNGSFETPTTGFVTLDLGPWQRLPRPVGYVGDDWNTLTGIFRNTAEGKPDHIANLDGDQALWVFNVPQAGVFQESVPAPDGPAAVFRAGHGYALSADFLGGGGNMPPGSTLELAIDFADPPDAPAVAVGSLVVVHQPEIFPDRQHVRAYRTEVPPLAVDHPAVGRAIRVRIQCRTPEATRGGYWDVDHVRLDVIPPPFQAPVLTIVGGIGTRQLQWDTVAGWSYQLEASGDLTGWSPVGGPRAGNGEPASHSPGPAGPAQAFYRVTAAPVP